GGVGMDVAKGGPADGGNACTTGDTCVAGTCVGGPAPDCNDGNLCTDDACDPAVGCTHANNTAPCDDGNTCTVNDACQGGACVGQVLGAGGNPGTDDACARAGGCLHTNNTAACEDGNACTAGDVCQDGTCVSGPPANCDDANPCTDDACDPASGCTHANNTAPCDDASI